MQRFGKFEILDLLGEGGFGRVFRAYDPHLKREVAIKTCRLADASVRRRFLREAEIAAGLRHPNIVVVHDLGEEAGEPFMVQEYLPGDDLETLIARNVPIALHQKVRWLRDIASALGFAHEHGVIHRDIKPQNIRVLPDGGIRVLDFGIAKRSADRATTALTQTGFSIGTLGYVAPEQLMGTDIDHRADIFSYGALAYRLLTYAAPFEGDTIAAVFYRIANTHPEWPPLVSHACPPGLIDCIDRCLAKQPDDRPRSCREIVAALDGIMASAEEPRGDDAAAVAIEQPARQPAEHARAWSGTLLPVAAVAVLLAATVGVILATAGRASLPPATVETPSSPPAAALPAPRDTSRTDTIPVIAPPPLQDARPAAPLPGTALVALSFDPGTAGAPLAGSGTGIAQEILRSRLADLGLAVTDAPQDVATDAAVLASSHRLRREIVILCRLAVTSSTDANEFGMASVTVTASYTAMRSSEAAQTLRGSGIGTGAGTSVATAAHAAVRRAMEAMADSIVSDARTLQSR